LVEKFLEGKGAVITGAAGGFGKGVAEAFAESGANLVLVDLKKEMLEETCKSITQKTGRKVIPILCDVSKSVQVEAMAEQAFEELDNVYILFNNAGIGQQYGVNIIKKKEDIFDRTMEVNLKGQWLVSKEICRKMMRQKLEPLAGKVIHTASAAGVVVNPALPEYSISKAGVIALVQILAKTLAPKITVNCISPGYHLTPIYNNDEKLIRSMIKEGGIKTPVNRIGTIEDVVNLVLFLASPASNFITGHNFLIDGGISEVGVPAHFLKTEV
jgi:NAD(P)-dependent dehydrogenase (short-subunit alcohol dehydrogenase family)